MNEEIKNGIISELEKRPKRKVIHIVLMLFFCLGILGGFTAKVVYSLWNHNRESDKQEIINAIETEVETVRQDFQNELKPINESIDKINQEIKVIGDEQTEATRKSLKLIESIYDKEEKDEKVKKKDESSQPLEPKQIVLLYNTPGIMLKSDTIKKNIFLNEF